MAPFPDWLVPMAATLTQERFTGPEWIFERKLDGIRLLAFKHGEDVRLYSRNRLPQRYPTVAEAIAELPVHDAILDGEAAWDIRIHSAPTAERGAYHVFDVLWLDGRNVTSLPLEERRALLKKLPLKAPLGRVHELKDDEALGARLRRGVGRRHRQAPRLAATSTAARRTGSR